MARAEFIWVESSSTSLDESVRTRRVNFGDGYVQDAPAGLNALVQQYSISMRDVDDTVANQIVAFLRARVLPNGTFESFDWKPLWAGGQTISVKAPSWKRVLSDTWGESHLTITFERMYEPSV